MKGKVLAIDDEKLICWSLQKELSREGYEVLTAQTAAQGLRLFEEEGADVVLLDIRLPDGDGKELLNQIRKKDPLTNVIMVTANDDIRTAVQCMHAGAFTYLHKPFDFDELRLNIEKAVEGRGLRKKVAEWESVERRKYDFGNIVAESAPMKAVLALVRQVVDSEASTVLLEGESGTGKDLIARTIHYGSRRGAKPFVSINCAAIPETLLESELFGHEKGAFTDARQTKKGLVEEASGGTLFLDEIGDMQKELQAKFLHLIDQKKFRKVGGLKEIESDIRIIAATNKDIKREVEEGRFREDLYYRLNVIPIFIPPLRERKADIPALANFFVSHFNREFRKSISGVLPNAMEILVHYHWPGNARELKNVIERAMILNQDTVIRSEHFPAEIDCNCVLKESRKSADKTSESNPDTIRLPTCLSGVPLEAIEKHAIILALESSGGNQSQAARKLEIGRDALRYKMQKYGLIDSKGTDSLSEVTQENSLSA
jgi:DNA-binding NtrC family response regulator